MNRSRSRGSKRPARSFGALDLEGKVAEAGGQSGFGLEVSADGQQQQQQQQASRISAEAGASAALPSAGIYGGRPNSAFSMANLRQTRLFQTPSVKQRAPTPASVANTQKSDRSGRSRFSKASNAMVSRSTSAIRRRAANSEMSPAVHVVCAISENLARETCVASLDAGSATSLQVTKQGNGQTYSETLAYLEILKPNEILLNEGRRNSQLVRKIMDLYNVTPSASAMDLHMEHQGRRRGRQRRSQNASRSGDEPSVAQEDENSSRFGPGTGTAVVKFISRACFDQTRGAELLQRIARKETCDATLLEEYILLSAAHAVLHYTQQSLGASLAANSLHLSVNAGGNNRMTIDRSTLLQLELLINSRSGKVKDSLIGSIDCTKTTVGSRLLRTNLISPPTRVDTINSRLELVDTFLANEDIFYTVLEHLSSLPDVDKMLTNVALIPRKKPLGQGDESSSSTNLRIASKGISALVCIKTTLAALPGFASDLQSQLQALEGAETDLDDRTPNGNDAGTVVTDRSSLLVGLGGSTQSPARLQRHHLLRAIIFSMRQPGLVEVLRAVSDIFTEGTTFSRNANAMRHQECFALKCEEDSMMSVLRRAFLANVDDIYKTADQYAEMHGFQVAVRHSAQRGYFLAVPSDVGTDLPQVFLSPSVSGRFITCTTEEISSYNTRAQDNVNDLLLQTNDGIQEVLETARSHYDAMAALCDAVALLDMCHSFADNVSTSRLPWCRPVVSERTGNGDALASNGEDLLNSGGALMIRNGRYGIDVTKGLASGVGLDDFIPNDTFASDEKNFTLVTGINGSGKSTYLKQIAIIVILAHCGSYVPAEHASIPIRDQLCTRIGNGDDQENNISTFMLEMKETAHICNHATDRSLVLVDELGRATSNEDGVAIAWSVSEYLLKKRAMTFFVTHYSQLSRLGAIYPNVQNMHLEASVQKGNDGAIFYTHKVKSGPCSVSTDYGVELAAACGWPSDVVQSSRQIESQAQALCPDHDLCEPQGLGEDLNAYKALVSLRKKLKGLLADDQAQSFALMRSALVKLHESTVPESGTELLNAMHQLLSRDWVQPRNPTLSAVNGANHLEHDDEQSQHRDGTDTSISVRSHGASIGQTPWAGQRNRGSAMVSETFADAPSQGGESDSEASSLSTSSSESDSSDDESSVSSTEPSVALVRQKEEGPDQDPSSSRNAASSHLSS